MGKSPEAAHAKRIESRAAVCAGSELLRALGRLDQLLAPSINAAQLLYGQEAAADPHRGLYISPHDLDRLLARPAGLPFDAADAREIAASNDIKTLFDEPDECPATLARLAAMYGLCDFDVALLFIALAPELDLRYERIYAFLQDDVTRRRPSVDLALNLLCRSAQSKLERRTHFATNSPLIRHGLVQLLADPAHLQPPLLSLYLKPEEQVVRFLLDQKSMDARLVQCCRLLEPTAVLSEVAVPEEIKTALPALLSAAGKEREPLRLYFRGQRGAQRRQTAEALAGMSAARMLLVDLETALASAADFATLLQLIFREACLLDALVYFEGLDALRGAERAPSFKCFSAALAESRATVIMAGTAPLGKALQDAGCAVLEVVFPRADFERRRASWQAALRRHGVKADAALTEELAGRFRLTHGEIDSAARAARARALWRQAARGSRVRQAQNGAREETADLYTAAREQSSDNLSSLASKISPRYELSDIVLPPDQLDQLTEICNRARFRHVVSGQWGFGRKSSLGNGLNALFSGPPGTGKTMAAEVIARELHLDLYKIDLSQIVSKYIGETEKNLDRIFREAQTSSSILFFDEADALFGKRSEVTDAHDRYANIEVGYLLQKMEEYDGIAILATNLRQNMDDAFLRRLHVHLEFPFPDESHRKSIWRTVFPQEAPLHAEVDFDRLAREIKLAGGNIRSIAMTAAYFAASNGGRISMSHLVRAARREFQKLGRGWTEEL